MAHRERDFHPGDFLSNFGPVEKRNSLINIKLDQIKL